MEYLDSESVRAMKSELDLFKVTPTQTAIESSYEVEYRPSATLDSSREFVIDVPASEDLTDLASTLIYVKCKVLNGDNSEVKHEDHVRPVRNFGNALFDQVDFYLSNTCTTGANNTYYYQAFLEETLFKHPNKANAGKDYNADETTASYFQNSNEFDLCSRPHIPLCAQDRLLINHIPLQFRLHRNLDSFALLDEGKPATVQASPAPTPTPATAAATSATRTKRQATDSKSLVIQILDITVTMKRCRIFPDVLAGLMSNLEVAPVKYFITRNDVRSFTIGPHVSVANIENVHTGVLPRRMIIGFVTDKQYKGDVKSDPFKFLNYKLNYIASNVDGVQVPSKPYTPNFDVNLYMREFISMYKYLNQDEGIPCLNVSYHDYKDRLTLFVFDYTPGGNIGAETGTLSLLRKESLKIEVKFEEALSEPLYMIVMAQFDNQIQIDKFRNVALDW